MKLICLPFFPQLMLRSHPHPSCSPWRVVRMTWPQPDLLLTHSLTLRHLSKRPDRSWFQPISQSNFFYHNLIITSCVSYQTVPWHAVTLFRYKHVLLFFPHWSLAAYIHTCQPSSLSLLSQTFIQYPFIRTYCAHLWTINADRITTHVHKYSVIYEMRLGYQRA